MAQWHTASSTVGHSWHSIWLYALLSYVERAHTHTHARTRVSHTDTCLRMTLLQGESIKEIYQSVFIGYCGKHRSATMKRWVVPGSDWAGVDPPRCVRDVHMRGVGGESVRETWPLKSGWHSIQNRTHRSILNNNNDNNGWYTAASSLMSSAGLPIVLVQRARAHTHTHTSIRWVKLPISV